MSSASRVAMVKGPDYNELVVNINKCSNLKLNSLGTVYMYVCIRAFMCISPLNMLCFCLPLSSSLCLSLSLSLFLPSVPHSPLLPLFSLSFSLSLLPPQATPPVPMPCTSFTPFLIMTLPSYLTPLIQISTTLEYFQYPWTSTLIPTSRER